MNIYSMVRNAKESFKQKRKESRAKAAVYKDNPEIELKDLKARTKREQTKKNVFEERKKLKALKRENLLRPLQAFGFGGAKPAPKKPKKAKAAPAKEAPSWF